MPPLTNGPDPSPLELLLVIVVSELIVTEPAKRRERVLVGIERAIGDPRIVPLHDGDHLRMTVELRNLYNRLLPSWLSRL